MGFRFKKNIKIAKGVSINLNKKSVGLSIGGKGAKYTVNSKGRSTGTVGIPGTGLSYSLSGGGGKKAAKKTEYKPVPKKPLKKGIVPLIITALFGWSGLHWFISGRIGMGLLYLFTFGLFFFGWAVDVIRQIVYCVSNMDSGNKGQE